MNASVIGTSAFHAQELSDELLVHRARSGAGYVSELAMERLVVKYEPLVRSRAKGFYLIGAERDDLLQEGRIGLYKAVRDFKAEKISSFRAFAEICISRQLITAIKTATRLKHQALNLATSVDRPIDGENRTLLDTLSDTSSADPQGDFLSKESSEAVQMSIMQVLSPLEQEVLLAYMAGQSYVEIASAIGRRLKSIDNALQRAKRKIGDTMVAVQGN